MFLICLDIQNVNIGLRVLYRPDVDNLPVLYKQYGSDYAERILPSIGNDVRYFSISWFMNE